MLVKEYKVVSVVFEKTKLFQRLNEQDFEKEVNQWIQKGYQPYGKLEVSYEPTGFFKQFPTRRLTQVLVKY